MSQVPLRYVLVTPAHNEEAYISGTIQSVVAQTRLPVRWVIVDDGSTDRTGEIIRSYESQNKWIQSWRMPERADRQFAAKVHAFNAGYEKLRGLPYEVIGSLDADLSFGPDHFEYLLNKFADNPRLGVAGTPFVENGAHYNYRFTNIEHVSGACQLFRRECFEEIGGYIPIKGGGIDWAAVTTARMKGWQTRTFVERSCVHHRRMGTGDGSRYRAIFRQGEKDYFLGGHPLWQGCRGFYQMSRSPYIAGGMLLLAGYFWASLRRLQSPIPAELVRFHRAEQVARLKRFCGHGSRSYGTGKWTTMLGPHP